MLEISGYVGLQMAHDEPNQILGRGESRMLSALRARVLSQI